MTDQPTGSPARVAPGNGPGRFLRSLTGVDESILATVPSERSKYTALGGVVLGTAITAMFSMSVALYFVFGRFQPPIFAFVPAWGFFILFLDRWLMSSASAPRALQRFLRLLPRFCLAVMFGFVIAEPLLLGLFHTAIEQRIVNDRDHDVESRRAALVRCNPVPGSAEAATGVATSPECKDLRLGVTTAAEARQRELDDAKTNAENLKKTIDADDAAYADLERKAREECNGTAGPEYSGRFGEGPNCRRLRAEADKYHSDHNIDANHDEYARQNERINQLTAEVADLRANAARDIGKAIDDAVTDYRNDQRKEIGLLERLRTLAKLSDEDAEVRLAGIGLRTFFVSVDCLPVLLKFLSGHNSYDMILADRLKRQERAEKVVSESHRRDIVRREALARYQLDLEHNAARSKAEFDARVRHVDVEVLREDLIETRAAGLLGDTPTVAIHGLPPRSTLHDDEAGRAS
ncbi:DUF4407 domain-containing protein [Dactylosporangium sp. CA-092794]|uniref:DUF4407 domain-containing protein n=1 Tax=Dactylosporangium sp. CA-092794 TaxID=3239929 RepID=UPI003D93B10D